MSEREWRFYLDDMRRFAEKVLAYSEGMNQARFTTDELKYDAILRNLELIGDAATHVPTEVREKYSSIPWRQIILDGKGTGFAARPIAVDTAPTEYGASYLFF
jgi:uncharacterized protein with HEPN domain